MRKALRNSIAVLAILALSLLGVGQAYASDRNDDRYAPRDKYVTTDRYVTDTDPTETPTAAPPSPETVSPTPESTNSTSDSASPNNSAPPNNSAKAPQLPPGVPEPLDPTDPTIQNSPSTTPTAQSTINNFSQDGGKTFTIPPPAPGGKSTGKVPPGLEPFYAQKISWGTCDGFRARATPANFTQECSYIIVPMDYSNPTGPTIAIAANKVTKTGATPSGSLLVNPGGPGFSGLRTAMGIATNRSDLLNDYSIIGFAPRGVSSSAPAITCASDTFVDAQSQGSDELSTAQLNQVLQKNTEACYTNTAKGYRGITGDSFIPHVGTNSAVKDIDVMRSIVGDARLNFIGFSYGTSLAYNYELQFPGNIRSLVIDGVVNPMENNPEEAVKYQDILGTPDVDPDAQIRGFQATFEQFASKCAQTNGFDSGVPCALGTVDDRDTLLKNYQAISQKAYGGKTYGSNKAKRPLSFQDFNTATIEALYSEEFWEKLNLGLAAAKANEDVADLFDLVDSYYVRDSTTGAYAPSTTAAFPTISCIDLGAPAPFDEAKARAAQETTFKVAPFTDPGPGRSNPKADWCTYYKHKAGSAKTPGKSIQALPNTLVISSTYDSATPYPGGVVLAKATGGTLLTVANPNHTAYTRIDCASQIVDTYLKTLTIPTNVPGETGVETKDIYSNVITGNQCQVDSRWRVNPQVVDVSTQQGATAVVKLSGLIRESDYELTITGADGSVLFSGKVRGQDDGTASITVPVPHNAAPGDYVIRVAGLEDINNPTVVAVTGLPVQKDATGIFRIAATVQPDPRTESAVPVPISEPDYSMSNQSGTSDRSAGNLARTGSTDVIPLLWLSGLLLLTGLISVVAIRRQKYLPRNNN